MAGDAQSSSKLKKQKVKLDNRNCKPVSEYERQGTTDQLCDTTEDSGQVGVQADASAGEDLDSVVTYHGDSLTCSVIH